MGYIPMLWKPFSQYHRLILWNIIRRALKQYIILFNNAFLLKSIVLLGRKLHEKGIISVINLLKYDEKKERTCQFSFFDIRLVQLIYLEDPLIVLG